MGGPGSGQWYRWDRRRTVEDCRSLDVRTLNRQGMLSEAGRVFQWAWWDHQTGERTASINIKAEKGYLNLSFRSRTWDEEWEAIEQFVPLVWTPCNFGGKRPWFICPGLGCGRRVAILLADGRRFLCRHCYRLPYASTLETPVDRLFRKANKIRQKLGGEAGMASKFPPRPKGMRHTTYEHLRHEATLAEETGFALGLMRFGISPDEVGF